MGVGKGEDVYILLAGETCAEQKRKVDLESETFGSSIMLLWQSGCGGIALTRKGGGRK